MAEITHIAVYPKQLQRRSIPLLCQVFNDKAVTVLTTLKSKLKILLYLYKR